ncbi:MAG: hypothetical protein ABGZ23_07440, partial [Fuerstiella sp.]
TGSIRSSRNPDKGIDATTTIKTESLRKSLLKILKSTPFGTSPSGFQAFALLREIVQKPEKHPDKRGGG